MRTVPLGHQGAGERLTVDRSAYLDEPPSTEQLGNVVHDHAGPRTTTLSLGKGRIELSHHVFPNPCMCGEQSQCSVTMTQTTCHMSISLDGFVAGPDQSRENPLGVGGMALHHWHLDEPLDPADARARDRLMAPRGAYVMGRNMFGPIRGPWDESWRGWWGEDPPYHAPVFVLTHHARSPIEMQGGTTFHFVTDGFGAAYEQAMAAAGDLGVDIAGGASTVRQAFAAGVVDELMLNIAPVLLGAGERLFDGVQDPGLELVEVIDSPLATHIRYAVER